MARVTFSIDGDSPILNLCTHILIENGYQVDEENPQFILLGRKSSIITDKPCIILSTGNVYSCLDSSRKTVEEPFSEHDALVVPSTSACMTQVEDILDEASSRSFCPNHAVLRIFEIYGGFPGIVQEYLYSKPPYTVLHSEYRKLSCLFIDDFKDLFLKFVQVFTSQTVRGVYNVAGDEIVVLKHLIEILHQTKYNTNEKPKIVVKHTDKFVSFYHVGDNTRIKAITGWTPSVSLRKGIRIGQ